VLPAVRAVRWAVRANGRGAAQVPMLAGRGVGPTCTKRLARGVPCTAGRHHRSPPAPAPVWRLDRLS
jgi:hypothetical protein